MESLAAESVMEVGHSAPAAALPKAPAPRPQKAPAPRPVFASADGRRARALGLVGRAVGALGALWLVALLAGALGLGRLPGVPLPEVGRLGSPNWT